MKVWFHSDLRPRPRSKRGGMAWASERTRGRSRYCSRAEVSPGHWRHQIFPIPGDASSPVLRVAQPPGPQHFRAAGGVGPGTLARQASRELGTLQGRSRGVGLPVIAGLRCRAAVRADGCPAGAPGRAEDTRLGVVRQGALFAEGPKVVGPQHDQGLADTELDICRLASATVMTR